MLRSTPLTQAVDRIARLTELDVSSLLAEVVDLAERHAPDLADEAEELAVLHEDHDISLCSQGEHLLTAMLAAIAEQAEQLAAQQHPQANISYSPGRPRSVTVECQRLEQQPQSQAAELATAIAARDMGVFAERSASEKVTGVRTASPATATISRDCSA